MNEQVIDGLLAELLFLVLSVHDLFMLGHSPEDFHWLKERENDTEVIMTFLKYAELGPEPTPWEVIRRDLGIPVDAIN